MRMDASVDIGRVRVAAVRFDLFACSPECISWSVQLGYKGDAPVLTCYGMQLQYRYRRSSAVSTEDDNSPSASGIIIIAWV